MASIAASNQGKTHALIHDFLLGVYKHKFSMIWCFGPTLRVDDTYKPLISYIEKYLKPKEEYLFEDFGNGEELERILSEQMALVQLMKEEGRKPFHVAVILEDIADDPRIARNSRILNSLFSRGRHAYLSVFCVSQSLRALAPLIRKNLSVLVMGRINNIKDLEAASEEFSLIAGSREEFIYKYWKAINDKPYSYIVIDLVSRELRIRLDGEVM
jgi:hypothetical protein